MPARKHLLAAGLAAGVVFAASPGRAQTFDGITIIELTDPAVRAAISGTRANDPRSQITDAGRYIVTFVSAAGTYASLTGRDQSRLCVAWAVPGSYTGSVIAFGLPGSASTIRGVNPSICELHPEHGRCRERPG